MANIFAAVGNFFARPVKLVLTGEAISKTLQASAQDAQKLLDDSRKLSASFAALSQFSADTAAKAQPLIADLNDNIQAVTADYQAVTARLGQVAQIQ